MRVNILRNNIEHYVAGSSSNAVIDVISSGGTYVAGVIQQNLIAIFGATDATSLITLREARGTLIQDNVFLSGIAGKTAVTLSNTCVDVRIGANSYNAAIATSGTKVNDSGTGTMGVKKNIALLNGWVEQTTFDTPTYSKDLSGNVVIEGVIKNGTATPGTVIFQLPLSARPPTGTVKRFNAYSVGGGGAEFGYFLIDEVGNATIEDGGNVQFFLSGAVFRASNASDSLSPE
jgi:small basic protein